MCVHTHISAYLYMYACVCTSVRMCAFVFIPKILLSGVFMHLSDLTLKLPIGVALVATSKAHHKFLPKKTEVRLYQPSKSHILL